MAKKKSLNNMFEQFEAQKEEVAEVVTQQEAPKAVKAVKPVKKAQNAPKKATETPAPAEAPTDYSNFQTQIKENLAKSYDAKYKRPTVNDTHTRTTFLLQNELADRLNALSEGKRGYKTEFLNTAIKQLLDIVEND